MELTVDVLEEAEQQVNRLRNVFAALADRAAAAAAEENEAAVSTEPPAITEPPLAGEPDAEPPAAAEPPVATDPCAAGPGETAGPGAALLARVAARNQAFADAMADDLNTAAALAEVFGLARESNAALAVGGLDAATASRVRVEMGEMVHVLGLDAVTGSTGAIPADIVAMAEERQQSRAARDFAQADALRAAIAERGYEVRDVSGGYKIVAAR